MKSCTRDFPVTIGERVFSPQLGYPGHVVGLAVDESGRRTARIEFRSRADKLIKTWVNCDRLEDPQPRSPSHAEKEATQINLQMQQLRLQSMKARTK